MGRMLSHALLVATALVVGALPVSSAARAGGCVDIGSPLPQELKRKAEQEPSAEEVERKSDQASAQRPDQLKPATSKIEGVNGTPPTDGQGC